MNRAAAISFIHQTREVIQESLFLFERTARSFPPVAVLPLIVLKAATTFPGNLAAHGCTSLVQFTNGSSSLLGAVFFNIYPLARHSGLQRSFIFVINCAHHKIGCMHPWFQFTNTINPCSPPPRLMSIKTTSGFKRGNLRMASSAVLMYPQFITIDMETISSKAARNSLLSSTMQTLIHS